MSPGPRRGQLLWAELGIARVSPGAFGDAAFGGSLGQTRLHWWPNRASSAGVGRPPGDPSGARAAGFGHAPAGSRGPFGVPEGSAALVCCTQDFVSVSWVEAPKGVRCWDGPGAPG